MKRSTTLLSIALMVLFYLTTVSLHAQLTFDPAQLIATEDGVVTVYTADLDNDGDQDLAVAIVGGVVIASNDGQQTFTVRSILSTDDDTMSLCAADYDNDGNLDIYG